MQWFTFAVVPARVCLAMAQGSRRVQYALVLIQSTYTILYLFIFICCSVLSSFKLPTTVNMSCIMESILSLHEVHRFNHKDAHSKSEARIRFAGVCVRVCVYTHTHTNYSAETRNKVGK